MKTTSKEPFAARAEDSTLLRERINQNEANQSLQLNDWAFSHLAPDSSELSILELCCGTGKQTQFLARHFPNATILATDLSPRAITEVEALALGPKVKPRVGALDTLWKDLEGSYDMVFVSYGLYYAADIDAVMKNIFNFLKPEGHLIVLGPYGENNAPLFHLLNRAGVTVDGFVKYSCGAFMQEKVILPALSRFSNISINTAVNTIKWKTPGDLLRYWSHTTFFDSSKKKMVKEELLAHFLRHEAFHNYKHIMLFQAQYKQGAQ